MSTPHPALAGRVYDALLRAYPPAFRAAFGPELAQVFRTQQRAAAQRGSGAQLACWGATLGDLAGSALRERWEEAHGMTGQQRLMAWGPWALAALGALVVGYVNTHTDEETVVLALLIIFGGLLGLLWPRHAWRWALIVGLAAPVGQAIFSLLHLHVPYPNDLPAVLTTGVIVVPITLVVTYVGVGARWLLNQMSAPPINQ